MRKHSVIIMILMVACMLLAGCGGSGAGAGNSGDGTGETSAAENEAAAEESPEDLQKGVAAAGRVYVHESGIAFFGYRNLLCTAKTDGLEFSEFIPDGQMTGNIYAITVDNKHLYISQSDGLFRYPLSAFTDGSGSVSPETVLSEPLGEHDHFEIINDTLYFSRNGSLHSVPVTGGSETTLADDITDFEVTTRGIYAAFPGGAVDLINLTSGEKETVGTIADGSGFTIGGSNLYYWDDGTIMLLSLKDGSTAEAGNDTLASDSMLPWSDGRNVFYKSANSRSFLMISPDGSNDVLFGCVTLPGKADGCVSDGRLVSFAAYNGYPIIQAMDMSSGVAEQYYVEREMEEYLDKLGIDRDNFADGTKGAA